VLLGWLVALVLIGHTPTAPAQDDALRYQPRAQRNEGIKPKLVGGFDIELLSARVDYQDTPNQLGERLQVRFFLPKRGDVHLVVRELDYLHYYWLDNARPTTPWDVGFNAFAWPTADVLQRLPAPPLRAYDLGVVARLDRPEPGAAEKVAPVVFYQSQFPERASAYVFHFRLREAAKVKADVFKLGNPTPIVSIDLGRQRGGRPFSVRWDATSPPAPEGAYKLVLSGYMLSNSDPVSQTVEFYHRPVIR
jgi:hypothetical protein